MTNQQRTSQHRDPQNSGLAQRTRENVRGRLRLRTKLGSFFLSDNAERYWRVHVRVSKRKGRYLKLEHQGTPGLVPVADCRATADDYAAPPNRPHYHHIAPDEWAIFAALANEFDGRAADADDPTLIRARATLDRIVGEHLRETQARRLR